MISLVQTTRLAAPPERVWAWFRELDDNYCDWHREHLRWRTLRGEPLALGTAWFADEWVGPLRIAARFFVTESEPDRFFAYRVGFPSSLVRAGGSFRLSPTPDGGCELTESVHLGFSTPLVGALVDRLLALFLPIGELRRHIREEGVGLARLLG
jgi:polyketide cyclase/dehydrase/lipid transport protein